MGHPLDQFDRLDRADAGPTEIRGKAHVQETRGGEGIDGLCRQTTFRLGSIGPIPRHGHRPRHEVVTDGARHDQIVRRADSVRRIAPE